MSEEKPVPENKREQPESVVIYERVLKGERWPKEYIGNQTSKGRSIEILGYVLKAKARVKSYEEAQKIFTKEFVKEYKLGRVIKPFYKPPELLPNEYDHILWLLWPDRIKGKHAMIIKVYGEVLSRTRRTFPRGYFTDASDGRYRAKVCIRHLCKKILHWSGDRIAMEFSHSNGIKTLAKYRLRIVLNYVYTSLSDMMYEVYPQFASKMNEYQALQDLRHLRKKERKLKMEISNAYATHPGKKAETDEKLNEDFAHAWEKDGVQYQAIADGNGSDEVLNPAAFVINEVQRFIDAYSEPNMEAEELKRMISGAIHCANRVLLAFKRANGEKYNASTFASFDMTALFGTDRLITAHVGDTRTYLFRSEKMHQLTKDQTEAQRLCDEGKIAKAQIFTHPDRDILTSALGFDNPDVEIREGVARPGDIFLLLTDGAHKVLTPEQIQDIVLSAGNCVDTCNGIIEGANLLGGPDNISVCVSYIPEESRTAEK